VRHWVGLQIADKANKQSDEQKDKHVRKSAVAEKTCKYIHYNNRVQRADHQFHLHTIALKRVKSATKSVYHAQKAPKSFSFSAGAAYDATLDLPLPILHTIEKLKKSRVYMRGGRSYDLTQ